MHNRVHSAFRDRAFILDIYLLVTMSWMHNYHRVYCYFILSYHYLVMLQAEQVHSKYNIFSKNLNKILQERRHLVF